MILHCRIGPLLSRIDHPPAAMKLSFFTLLAVLLTTTQSTNLPDSKEKDCTFPICTLLEGEGEIYSCIDSNSYPDGTAYIATHDELTAWAFALDPWCMLVLTLESPPPDLPTESLTPSY
jgi:hypothetical protein